MMVIASLFNLTPSIRDYTDYINTSWAAQDSLLYAQVR
jgi:hypothetical protein